MWPSTVTTITRLGYPLRFRRGLILGIARGRLFAQYVEVFRYKIYRQYIANPGAERWWNRRNVGMVSSDRATRLPHVRVHSYEPHPGTFAMLAEKWPEPSAQTGNMPSEAVSREPGILTF